MRRMYSQAELSAIIKEVFLEDVASGQIDLPDLIEQALPEVNPAGLDFSNVDFVAKTVNQINNDWELEIDENTFEAQENWVIEPIYCKLFVRNAKLCGVFLIGATNNTGASATPNVYTKAISIPTSYAEKLYDYAGHKVSEQVSPANLTCFPSTTTSLANGGARTAQTSLISNSNNANEVKIFFGGSSIASGSTLYIEARFWLSLI